MMIRPTLAGGILLLTSVLSSACDEVPETALPFSGSDRVLAIDRSGRNVEIACRIEDVKGETLTVRRNGRAAIEFLRLRDVREIFFARPLDWAQGRQAWLDNDRRRAFEYFDRAIGRESRPWARNELMADAARFDVKAGRRNEAVDRIIDIFDKDPHTRHVALLPLTWDERLLEGETVSAPIEDLSSESEIRRLVACSVWLHHANVRQRVIAELTRIRRTTNYPRISKLAETQLWRDKLLFGDASQPVPDHFRDLIQQLPPDVRGGPAHVLGRLLAKRHQYDEAALTLLWLPFMQNDDAPLAASSLAESIRCLRSSGRREQAEQLRKDLLAKYPDTSAAGVLKDEQQ